MLTGGNGRLIRFARTGANAMCNLPPLLYDCELSNLSLLTWQSHCSAFVLCVRARQNGEQLYACT